MRIPIFYFNSTWWCANVKTIPNRPSWHQVLIKNKNVGFAHSHFNKDRSQINLGSLWESVHTRLDRSQFAFERSHSDRFWLRSISDWSNPFFVCVCVFQVCVSVSSLCLCSKSLSVFQVFVCVCICVESLCLCFKSAFQVCVCVQSFCSMWNTRLSKYNVQCNVMYILIILRHN